MKKIIVVPILLCCFYFSNAQEVYFTHGKNLTKYEPLNATSNQLPMEQGIGSSFEIGYKSKYISNTSFYYTLGVAYNQFNALGKTTGLNMDWKTNYIGLNTSFDYSFIKSKRSTVSLKLGTIMQTLVYGKQTINEVQMDIVDNREFSGFNLGLQSGLKYHYRINSDCGVNAGYTYVQLFNLSNSMPEKNILTNQNWSIGFTFAIK
jgi:hypothetical protein